MGFDTNQINLNNNLVTGIVWLLGNNSWNRANNSYNSYLIPQCLKIFYNNLRS